MQRLFTKKKISIISVIILLVFSFILIRKARTEERPAFTIVVIPDTQKLSSDEEFGNPQKPGILFERMKEMAHWIVDQKDSLKIVMVAHLGDMTEDHDDEIQWERNLDTWQILTKAGIPFIPCQGNHDSISSLNKYFPVSDFSDKTFWGSSLNNGIENAYYFLDTSQLEFILAIRQNGANLEADSWLNEVFSKYADKRAIFISHAGMSQMKGGTYNVDNIVNKHDNIFMAHMGHVVKNDGNEYWTTSSPDGNIQHILRSNYQNRKDTLDKELYMAMLRYYTFKPDENRVFAYTYNVTTESYHRDKDHQFSFSYDMSIN